jgi:hypothetical protein
MLSTQFPFNKGRTKAGVQVSLLRITLAYATVGGSEV